MPKAMQNVTESACVIILFVCFCLFVFVSLAGCFCLSVYLCVCMFVCLFAAFLLDNAM